MTSQPGVVLGRVGAAVTGCAAPARPARRLDLDSSPRPRFLFAVEPWFDGLP